MFFKKDRLLSVSTLELGKLVEEVRSQGIDPTPLINFIGTLYMAQDLPYERELKPAQPIAPIYRLKQEVIFQVEKRVLRVLKHYGLISETTRYGKVANVRYYRLKGAGLKLGSQTVQQRILQVKDELLAVLKSVPRKLVRIIAVSSISPRDGSISWIRIPVNGSSLGDSFLRTVLDFKLLLVKPEDLRRIYESSKRLYGNLSLVFDKLREVEVEIYTPHIYEIFASRILLSYEGKMHREALNLMEKLCSLGLALKIPVYSSSGEYLGDEYKASPEVAHVLLQYSSPTSLEDFLKAFLAADLLLKALQRKLAKGELLRALGRMGVSETEVKIAVNILHAKGITSKYNERGGPESPPFIILNEDEALREALKLVSAAEEAIIGED
ncbi:MAG: hypothetical protein DRJ52_10810 [Thermoprotei archaeon]|nr:MAG: hypothetical protein DRJ52_10810 [Thermoprotei archaeon]